MEALEGKGVKDDWVQKESNEENEGRKY